MRHRRLLASIHDVTPVHAGKLDQLVRLVESCIGAGNFALLAVPDFHGEGLIDSDRAFATRLRKWSDSGCEVFLHGYFHRDSVSHHGRIAKFKARHLTASEGEFLGLDYATATRLMVDGRKRVEDVIGRGVSGFVAPAWLYSKEALQAIAEQGFTLAEDHFKVWHPVGGKVLARGPVITYASRSPLRLLSSLAWSRIASVALKLTATVRLGVHPHDVDAPELVLEIERALNQLKRTHRPSHYRDLLATDFSKPMCGNETRTASDLL